MINPLDLLQFGAARIAESARLFQDGRKPEPEATPEVAEYAMVYRDKDFDSLNDEIIRTYHYWSRFRGLIVFRRSPRNFPEKIAEWSESLCNELPIRAELDLLAAHRQAST